MTKSDKPYLDILKTLYQNRKFLITYLILVALISVAIALSVRKTFSSYATVITPSSSSSFPGILPSEMTMGLSGTISSLTGGTDSDMNKLLSILNSRELAISVINKFELMERFEAPTVEDAIESYREIVSYTIDDQGMVSISVHLETEVFHPENNENEVRLMSRDMCMFILDKLDDRFTELKIEKARYDRILVEKRLEQNVDDLDAARLALQEFSEEYNIVSLPEQVAAMVTAAADIESQLLINKIELGTMQNNLNENSAELRSKRNVISELESTLNDFLSSQKIKDTLSVFPSFENTPELGYQYANIQTEISVQSILYEYLIQQYEQVKLQEAKESPTLQFIDLPDIPTKRSGPVRSILTIGLFLLGSLFGVGYILFNDIYKESFSNAWGQIKEDR